MTVKTWLHKDTGLPTFYLDKQDLNVPVYAGSRLVRAAENNGGTVVFSDPFATPGVPTVYKFKLRTVTMTRPGTTMGTQIVTDLQGHQIPGLGAQPVPVMNTWKSSAKVWETGAVRYPPITSLRTGETQFILYDPTREADMWDLLQSHTPLIITTGMPVPGRQEMRAVVVSDVTQTWIGHVGYQRWNVKWTEYTGPTTTTASALTWGTVQAKWRTWQHMSWAQAAHELTGMPL